MSPDSHQHIVLGAGPLGRAVVKALAERGRSVRVVSRRGRPLADRPGVAVTAADLYTPSAVEAATRGAAVVYQCAQPEYHEWPEKFPPLQAAILEGLARHPAAARPKLVIAENLYMYGDPQGQPLREDTPLRPHTRKGRVRAELSAAALAAHQAGTVRVALGRASDFFGPHVLGSSLGDRVFYPALAGRAAQVVGRLNVPHTHTSVADFGRALVALGEHEAALGQAWHVPNDQPEITQGEIVRLIFAALGRPARVSAAPRWAVQLVGLFNPGARETVEMLYEFERPFVVDSSKFERAFGLRATPLLEALAQTVAWYQAHPAPRA